MAQMKLHPYNFTGAFTTNKHKQRIREEEKKFIKITEQSSLPDQLQIHGLSLVWPQSLFFFFIIVFLLKDICG